MGYIFNYWVIDRYGQEHIRVSPRLYKYAIVYHPSSKLHPIADWVRSLAAAQRLRKVALYAEPGIDIEIIAAQSWRRLETHGERDTKRARVLSQLPDPQ